MKILWTLAWKDLRLLGRDRFGVFWVLAFPLMMALLFGAIFVNFKVRLFQVGYEFLFFVGNIEDDVHQIDVGLVNRLALILRLDRLLDAPALSVQASAGQGRLNQAYPKKAL